MIFCRCNLKTIFIKGLCHICRRPEAPTVKKTEAPAGHPVDCLCDLYFECSPA